MVKNMILVVILLLIAGGAVLYLYRAKKQGAHCVGCPHAKLCKQKSCSCSLPSEQTTNE